MNALAVDFLRANSPALLRCREISPEAEMRFQQTGYFALRDIRCDVDDGVVYLRGPLPSRYLKQIAQAIAAEIEGVRHVVNQIEVIAPVNLARSRGANAQQLIVSE